MAHEELKKQYEEDCKHFDRPWDLWEFSFYEGIRWYPCSSEPSWHPYKKYRRKEPVFEPEYFSGLNRKKAIPYYGKKVEYSYEGFKWEKGVLKLVDETGTPFEIISTNTHSRFWVNYLKTIPETYQGTHELTARHGFKLHNIVMVYDRYRFAIPLKAEIVEFSSVNDGVRLLLHESNHRDYPKGCSTVWVHEAQLRKIDSSTHPTSTLAGGWKLPMPEVKAPRHGATVWIVTPSHRNGYIKSVWQGYAIEQIALEKGCVHLTEDSAQAWASWWRNDIMAEVKK